MCILCTVLVVLCVTFEYPIKYAAVVPCSGSTCSGSFVTNTKINSRLVILIRSQWQDITIRNFLGLETKKADSRYMTVYVTVGNNFSNFYRPKNIQNPIIVASGARVGQSRDGPSRAA